MKLNTMQDIVYFYADYEVNENQVRELERRYHTKKDLEDYLASITSINVKTDKPRNIFVAWLERFA